jgi:hypothetical protein
MAFDKEEFFKKQLEECRELEQQSLNAEDRAFWRLAGERWQEQLRQAQSQARKKATTFRADKASFKYSTEA